MNTSEHNHIGTDASVETLVDITPLARRLGLAHTVKLNPRLAQLYGLSPGLPAEQRPDLEFLLVTIQLVWAGGHPGKIQSITDSRRVTSFSFDPARHHNIDNNFLGITVEENHATEPPELILSTVGQVRKSVLLVTKDPKLVNECSVELAAAKVELVLEQELAIAPRQATQRRFDVVVLDLEHPVELSVVRRMHPLPTLPHVLLTTRDLTQFRAVAFDLLALHLQLFERAATPNLIGQVLTLLGCRLGMDQE